MGSRKQQETEIKKKKRKKLNYFSKQACKALQICKTVFKQACDALPTRETIFNKI
jgi:CRISPR/Cas system CSM-associated protein Csm4 (group 5 of RAMP superfamily)